MMSRCLLTTPTMHLRTATMSDRDCIHSWRSATRAAATVAAITGLAVLVAACGGSSPATTSRVVTSTGASTGPPSATGFARCMRAHGVQHWPDPDSAGQFDKSKLTLQQLGVVQSQLQTAQRACQHLYPTSSQSAQTQDQGMMVAMFKFARCMRAHGVADWPDPVAESDPGQPNTPGFPRNMPDINQNSPQVKTATKSCQHVMAGIGYGSGGYP